MDFSNLKLNNIKWVGYYRPPTHTWTAENRKTHVVGIQLTGYLTHSLKNQKFNISENCIYFLNQKDDYSVEVKNLENTESLSIHFTTYEPITTESFCIKLNNVSEVTNLLKKIFNQHESLLEYFTNKASNFYQLCALFEQIRRKKYAPNDTRILSAMKYINECFTENDCLEKASASCNVSRRRFNDLFKRQYSVTPHRYIILRRIEYAQQLLCSSSLSVQEISDTCGFADVYYFSKVFKHETGYPPAKYKQHIIQ